MRERNMNASTEFVLAKRFWQNHSMSSVHPISRRHFLASASLAALSTAAGARAADAAAAEAIIDIHQHTTYLARTDEELIAHQRAMGVTQTILLPAGTPVNRASTHDGKSNGLAAKCSGNESVIAVARAHPNEFFFGANVVTDLENAVATIKKILEMGAKVIGEQKFGVECDSEASEAIYRLAQEFDVPVLMHFQHAMYNLGIDRFHRVLEKFPKVRFVAHAQTFWANIDANHRDQTILYPKGPVTRGGISDKLLSDYPNFFGDMSAGSGLNALTRDEEHARGFLERHQDKLMFGSDCADPTGVGAECTGAQILAAIRRLAGSKAVERKLLSENAKRLFRL
jgi:predicted TIM-barrel fold metal-dependent hydrolase